MRSEVENMQLEGQQVGHFRLLSLLGSGGMGAVYLAEDLSVQRQVAIKVIRTESALNPEDNAAKEAAYLFKREANAVAMLDHPNILPLFDYGEEPLQGEKLTYMVMPFRQEGSLADWLRKTDGSRWLTTQNVAFLIHQAASALQYAHDHHIIHRDVKPSNFLIRGRPENPAQPDLLLADFGIAKFSTAISSADTLTRGTPTYMAPEQWQDHPVPATDQYALAVMTYVLLTGRPPFQGNHSQLMYQHFHVQPNPLSSINSRVSADIDSVLLRALAKQPKDRFPSIASFDQAFQQAVSNINKMHVTLTINQMEAINGTSRTITLPDRRMVTVTVPAGAYDGQIIQSEASNYGDLADALVITIAISRVDETVVSLQDPKAIENTLPEQSTNRNEMPNNHRPGFSSGKIMILALVLLLIAGSVGLYFVNMSRQNAIAQENATATAMANSTATSDIATANTQMTGTAQAVATDEANATATAQAIATDEANATATAQAIATDEANATATAIAATTATFIAQNPDPYFPKGKLAFYDELSNNSNGYSWDENTTSSGACEFSGGSYHVIESQATYFHPCFAQQTNFSNFAFQLQMTIIKGDCGGIFFRANSSAGKYYLFEICQCGNYRVTLYTNNSADTKDLANSSDPAINTGLNQSNQIAVVANGSVMDLYVNTNWINRINDSTYSSGQIGIFADDYNNATEAAFSNAEVWTF